MARKKFNLPDPGEGLVEAEIVEWKVAVGDTVTVNQILLEIETAKSLVELPSPWAGTVVDLLVQVGQTIPVGTPIVVVDDGTAAEPAAPAAPDAPAKTEPSATTEAPAGTQEPAKTEASAKPEPTLVGYGAREGATTRRARKAKPTSASPAAKPVRSIVQESFDPELMAVEPEHPGRQAMWQRADESERTDPMRTAGRAVVVHPGGRPKAKPPVRKYARDHGVDLMKVTPTGDGGHVTLADIDAFLAAGSAPAQAPAYPTGPAQRPGERETRTPVKGVRKMMAQAMVGSAFTAPHVTEWITVDATATTELVERLKNDREFRTVRVTPLLILAKAICLALRRHPEINATFDDEAGEVVVKHYVNLGIAAATPRGLLVPNIKDADAMSLLELAEQIGRLVTTAREGRTQPADMAGGTFTITNVGVFGIDGGTPIINPGESAILAFGAIRRMPWVVTRADGTEAIEPRSVTTLALSFDHRHVDGELGSRFLADVAAVLHDPARGLVWG